MRGSTQTRPDQGREVQDGAGKSREMAKETQEKGCYKPAFLEAP